jgi:hypothetical protein
MMKFLSKRSLVVLLYFMFNSSVFAVKPGAYLGVAAGYTKTDLSSLYEGFDGYRAKSDSGIGGRVYFGANVSEYCGIEFGVSKYHLVAASYDLGTGAANSAEKVTFNNYSYDFIGKLYLPINPQLDFYTLGGVSVVHNNVELTRKHNTQANIESSNVKYLPRLGFGLDYAFSEQFSVGGEISHIFGESNLKTTLDVPSASMLLLTISRRINN